MKERRRRSRPRSRPWQAALRQVTANTGKPLTPVEQGMAYKSIIEEEGWTQAQLAKALGIPKSTVGDRIRLIELDPVWLDLMIARASCRYRTRPRSAPVRCSSGKVPSGGCQARRRRVARRLPECGRRGRRV
jgi:DNA-binding XRE family transcriptional regulator